MSKQTFVFHDLVLSDSVALAAPVVGMLFLLVMGAERAPPLVLVALLAMLVLGAVAFLQSVVRAKATVGADGIALSGPRPPRLGRFIPFHELREVHIAPPRAGRFHHAIILVLEDGRSHRLVRVRDPDAFKDAVDAGLRAYRARPDAPIPPLPETTEYRVAALPRERLLQIAAEPAAGPKLRVRAAELAAEDGARTALGELAEVTADPIVEKALRSLSRD